MYTRLTDLVVMVTAGREGLLHGPRAGLDRVLVARRLGRDAGVRHEEEHLREHRGPGARGRACVCECVCVRGSGWVCVRASVRVEGR